MADIDFYGDINVNQNKLVSAALESLASAPGTPVAGQLYYDTTDSVAKVYTGSVWAPATFDTSALAGTGLSQTDGDTIEVDTTWADARYALLSGAVFTGDISLGSVILKQGSAGLMDATGVSASLFKSSLTSAGITTDGVYLFEDGSLVTLVTDSGRLHVTYTNNTGLLIRSETSQADNTYHSALSVSSGGVAVYADNSGGTPVAGSSYAANAAVSGTLTVGGAEVTKKFTATIGDNSATTFELSHNFNSAFPVSVVVRDTGTGEYVSVPTEDGTDAANQVKLVFASAPTTNQFDVFVTG